MNFLKVYIGVTLFVNEQGSATPLSITYCDREFAVDKVVDVRTTPPEHVGGLITKRYDCLICGKVRHLYVEISGRWFVEAVRT